MELPWACLSSAAVNISTIYTAWRKYTGPKFFWLLHCYSHVCLMWTLEVQTPWSGQHIFQYVCQLSLKYIFYHSSNKLFPLLFTHTLQFSMKLCSVYSCLVLCTVVKFNTIKTQNCSLLQNQ